VQKEAVVSIEAFRWLLVKVAELSVLLFEIEAEIEKFLHRYVLH